MSKVEHDLTAGQWTALVGLWGGCAYCGAVGVDLQKDCMLPISRGGRYTLTNVVPACRSCNASKGNVEVTTCLRNRGSSLRSRVGRQLLRGCGHGLRVVTLGT